MRRFAAFVQCVAALAIAASSISAVPAAGEVQAPENWYKNCANYGLQDHCIESVEYFDETTQTWVKAIAEKNPVYHEGPITDEDRQKYASGENYVSDKCGYGAQLGLDTCYRVPGAAKDGSTQTLHTVVYGETEDLKMSFEATDGPETFIRARYGDTLWLARDNSLWRMTVVSDLFAQDAGIAQAEMKEPAFDVFKGADGHWRIQASGRIQSIYTLESWEPSMPTCDDAIKSRNDYKANEVRRPFSINIGRYKYEYEKLKGSPPAGVFITSNGGCRARLSVDPTSRLITVAAAGPHFDTNGNVIDGWVEASIRGDVIRKAFNAEPKTMNQAIVEVTYTDGTSQNATSNTKYDAATDKVEIRAYGFHYSAPTVKLRLQPASTPVPAKPKAGKPTYTCVKGKTVKKFVGKCPAGWKKK